jgi:hypothetical protein
MVPTQGPVLLLAEEPMERPEGAVLLNWVEGLLFQLV